MTSPKPEREWLAELREAASTPPVDPWLLYVVDERLAELNATPAPSAEKPPVGTAEQATP